MPGSRADAQYAAQYAAVYREHNAQLVAYARSLTGSATMAEDLAAEAHFRVWRRIQAGHEIENVAAYLTTTVRNLAAGLGRAQREVARDIAELPQDPALAGAAAADPEQRASHVDLITRLLKELPDRWAKALWYAEVEDLPMEAVGEKIGASAGTTAVVLTRARERLRQAFLLSQPGTPLSGDCEPYWKHMATIVRGTASARRTKAVTEHCDECDDCRSRMFLLTETNTRLPALLGPALLAGVLGGGAWFAPAIAGAGAGAAAGTAVRTGSHIGRHARITARARVLRHGLTPTKSVVIGSAAAVGIAATVATIALGSTDRPATTPHAAAQQTSPAAIQPTAASGSPIATQAAPASTQAAAASTQAAATAAAAAPTSSAATTSAYSAAAQSPAAVATQAAQVVPPVATTDPAAATTPPTTPATSASANATPSGSASTAAGPVVVDTPTPSPSQTSAGPIATPTPTSTPSPSQSVTPTPTPTATPTETCYWFVVEACWTVTNGD